MRTAPHYQPICPVRHGRRRIAGGTCPGFWRLGTDELQRRPAQAL
ncbi:MAG: hypothetical protein WAT67_10745 [Candidatus Contendobacter sp.]